MSAIPFAAALAPDRPPVSRPAAAAVMLAHAALLGLLLRAPATPEPATRPQTLTVSLIEPEVPQPQPQSAPRPQHPRPVVKPLSPPPVRVAGRSLPTPPQVIEAPMPVVEPEPAPAPAPPPAPVAAMASAPLPSPPPPMPPRPVDYLNNPKPTYPALSRRLGEEGSVHLRVLVNADGSVARLEMAKSSGHPRLDRSAMETVPSWKFVPAQQGGKPIADWVTVPIQFTLRS